MKKEKRKEAIGIPYTLTSLPGFPNSVNDFLCFEVLHDTFPGF